MPVVCEGLAWSIPDSIEPCAGLGDAVLTIRPRGPRPAWLLPFAAIL